MSRIHSLLRALPAAVAATLAACSDAPLGPATPSAAPHLARGGNGGNGGVSALPNDSVYGVLAVRTQTASAPTVPGTKVVFFANNLPLWTVPDNGTGDLDPRAGYYKVVLPKVSGGYKAELADLPLSHRTTITLNQSTGKLKAGEVAFSDLQTIERSAVHVSLLSLATKAPAPGATLTLVAGGIVARTVVDGADQSWDGSIPLADGKVTFYIDQGGTFDVCETVAPIGYLRAEPSCQTFSVQSSASSAALTFLHQTGIIAPPPEA
jgi:hypothetical protein